MGVRGRGWREGTGKRVDWRRGGMGERGVGVGGEKPKDEDV